MRSIVPFICLVLPCLIVAGCSRDSTKDVDASQFAYNLKTTVYAYESVGHKNWSWHSEAKRCLVEFARIQSLTNQAVPAPTDELRGLLARLYKIRCDDPLVQYLWTRFVFSDSHSPRENAQMYNTVATALQKTRYPDIRKFYATAWAYRMQLQAERNSPQLATTLDTANSYLVNALADQSMPLSEAEEGCDFLFSSDLWSEPAAWKSYQALEQF